jgi:hypothetical protein
MRVEVSPLRWFLSVAVLATAFTSIVLAAIWYIPFVGQKPTKETLCCCNVCRRRQRIASTVFLAGFLTTLVAAFVSPALHDIFHPGVRRLAPKTSRARESCVDRRARARYHLTMDTLAEIKAAASALPPEQKKSLAQYLLTPPPKQGSGGEPSGGLRSRGHSILDIQPVSLGSVLSPLSSDDDLLGEMLEGRP